VVPAVATTRELDDARTTIESWAYAWSERDVSGYLAHYGDGFTPERGMSRAAWEKSRRQMIERRRSIAVSIANLRLEQVSDNRIVARYVQDYAADAYRETGTPKRLVLARESSGWRIVAETADTAGAGSS
jgi:ketosteroid isomerase-like protein